MHQPQTTEILHDMTDPRRENLRYSERSQEEKACLACIALRSGGTKVREADIQAMMLLLTVEIKTRVYSKVFDILRGVVARQGARRGGWA